MEFPDEYQIRGITVKLKYLRDGFYIETHIGKLAHRCFPGVEMGAFAIYCFFQDGRIWCQLCEMEADQEIQLLVELKSNKTLEMLFNTVDYILDDNSELYASK